MRLAPLIRYLDGLVLGMVTGALLVRGILL